MTPRIGAALVSAWLLAASSTAVAAEGEVALVDKTWPEEGVFGTFDRAAVQRGFQVYKEVCQACHGVSYLSFRNLGDLGFSDDEVRAIAAGYEVTDGPNDSGEMFQRPGRPSDHIPVPFANPEAARAANGGALPPDLSLVVKAREGGSDYIYSLLLGYEEPPASVTVPEGLHYNAYFPGHMIAMPPPLSPDQVTFADGTSATVEQMASDVTQFLHWVAEPKLEDRKRAGLRAMIFLVAMTGILYAYKRKVWADLH